MKKLLVKGIALTLSGLILCQITVPALALNTMSTSEIIINSQTFPDSNFRNWLTNSKNINGYGSDGKLTQEELANIKMISLSNQNISSLDGIGYFTNLEWLVCSDSNLTSIDLDKNTQLIYLNLSGNKLESIDLSKLINLDFVSLNENNLKNLDLSSNNKLNAFIVNNNEFKTLILPNTGKTIDFENFKVQNSKEGYSNIEWYTDGSFSQKVTEPITANGQTLYAEWIPNTYTIRYSANGGSGQMESQSATWDTEVTLSDNQFTRVGYTFDKWEDGNRGNKYYKDGETVTNIAGKTNNDSITLYAKWTPITYSIQYHSNNHENKTQTSSVYRYDTDVTLTKCTFTPEENKYFAGWSTEPTGEVQYKDEVIVRNLSSNDGDIVDLYAVWRESNLKEILAELDEVYARYNQNEYTSSDWNKLTQIYQSACEAIKDNEAESENISASAKINMDNVLTISEHCTNVYNTWKNEYAEALSYRNDNKIDESNAEYINKLVLDAINAINTEYISKHTNLQLSSDVETIYSGVLLKSNLVFDALNDVIKTTEWVKTLNGISVKPMNEVKSSDFNQYLELLQKTETRPYLLNVSKDMKTDILERKTLAENKLNAVNELHSEYQKYDFSLYTDENVLKLQTIMNTGLTSVELKSSLSEINDVLQTIKSELASIPKKEQSGNGGSTGGNGGSTGGSSSSNTDSSGGQNNNTQESTTITVTGDNGVKAEVTTSENGSISAVITVPNTSSKNKITIPCKTTNTTVAYIVNEDGTKKIMPFAVATDNGMNIPVEQNCKIEIVTNNVSYNDIKNGSWYEDAVKAVAARELFTGVSQSEFAPNENMNRAMIWTVLARLEGEDTSNGSNWYEQGQKWAVAKGISDGLDAMNSMTREQLATMLYRYAGSPKTDEDSIKIFNDSYKISSWSSDALNWAVSQGLITGMGDGTLNPQGEATRAEVATILMRFISNQ